MAGFFQVLSHRCVPVQSCIAVSGSVSQVVVVDPGDFCRICLFFVVSILQMPFEMVIC
jgi:hypothetical protein